MARISEIVVAIEAEGTEKVLAALNQVEGAQVKTVKTTKQLGAQTKQATEQASAGWATLVTGVNQAIGVLQKVVRVGKAVYDFTKQGAELEFMAGKFDRLSLSIGTTSDVLLDDLRRATQGTRSDMELMASASDFMSLGLAKTSDEVVRLSTVAGALNMDMNQLVLTLANQTTMRFDQLGVSVDGFEEKVKSLKAAGMSASDAFKEAFLQQAEEQLLKVGNAADSSLGGLMQMESAFKNLSDVMKTDFADSMNEIAPLLTDVANGLTAAAQNGINYRDVMRQMKSALDAGVISTADYNRVMKEMGVNSAKGTVSAEKLQVATEFLSDAYAKTGATVDMTAESLIDYYIKLAQTKTLLDEIPGAANGASDAIAAFALTSDKAAEKVDNFLAKATLFKDDFGEMFDLGNVFSQQNVDIEGLIDNLSVVMDQYIELKENLEQGFTAATMRVNVAVMTLKESLANDLKNALDAAGLSVEQLKEGYAGIDQLLGTNLKIGLELEELGDEFSKGFINALKKGKLNEFLSTNGEAYIEAAMKLDVDVVEAKAAIAELQEVKDAVMAAAELTLTALVDDAKVKEYQAPTKYGTVIYLPKGSAGPEAIGGPVYPNNTYLWQEPNREGELFIPEQYGRVMNNHQVAQMMRDAMFLSPAAGARAGGGTVSTDNSRHASYTINAMYKQEPAITLSQHLQILNYLGGRA